MFQQISNAINKKEIKNLFDKTLEYVYFSFTKIISSGQKAVIYNLAKDLDSKYEIKVNSMNMLQTFMDYDDRKVSNGNTNH